MKSIWTLGLLAVAAGAAGADTLYHNGPVVDANGLSILQPPNSTLGLGVQVGNGNSIADDFTVGGAGWTVQSLSFYAYQTNAVSNGFTSATWSIVSGDVNSGTVVASGSTAVTDGGLEGYRVTPTTLTSTARAIYELQVDVADFNLAAGSYWLRWSLVGNPGFSGPWQPTTADGALGNLHQSVTAGPFNPWADAGSGLGHEAPFTLHGVAAVPEPGTYALMLLGLAGLGAVARRRR